MIARSAALVLLTASAAFAGQTEETWSEGDLKLDYLLHLPEGYEDSEEAYPLVLFLHGAGERGDDVSKVAKHGPPKLIKAGKDLPAVVVSPQCPAGQWWSAENAGPFLKAMVAKYRVDADRVYVTGLSMGGYGTWALIAETPGTIAAAAPVCGGGKPAAIGDLNGLPVWAFHGDADSVVPLSQSEKMVEAAKENGGDVKLTVYPGVQHDSWTRTYDDPAFWEWLFSKKRSDRG